MSKPAATTAAPETTVARATAEAPATAGPTAAESRESDASRAETSRAETPSADTPRPDTTVTLENVVIPRAPVQPPPVSPPVPAIEASSLGTAVGESVATRAPQPPPTAAGDNAGDERAIRSVLSRYEAAYNRLDAAAAGAVRPSVDREALARAFEGLASQTVRLGTCDVKIAGSSAQAACNGMARWTPKIGGQTQTATRQWRFDLKKTGADWIIASATVR
jgi:hypothetical protein